jgi:hypothetical protein
MRWKACNRLNERAKSVARLLAGQVATAIILCGLCSSEGRATDHSVLSASMGDFDARRFVLEGSALQISAQVYGVFGRHVRVGPFACVGPTIGVAVLERNLIEREDLTEYANAGLAVSFSLASHFGLELSPLRLAVVVGSDWGQVYPSGHVKLWMSYGRVRFASQLTAIRIAGGHGTGKYPVFWIPVLVAFSF